MQYYYIFSVRLAVKTIHCCQTRLDGTTQSLCSSFCKNGNAKYSPVEKMNRAFYSFYKVCKNKYPIN